MENIHSDTCSGINPLYGVPWAFPAPTQLDNAQWANPYKPEEQIQNIPLKICPKISCN